LIVTSINQRIATASEASIARKDLSFPPLHTVEFHEDSNNFTLPPWLLLTVPSLSEPHGSTTPSGSTQCVYGQDLSAEPLRLHDYDFNNIDWTLDFPATSNTTTTTTANNSFAAGDKANDDLLSTQHGLTRSDGSADSSQDLPANNWSQQNTEHVSTLFELPTASIDFSGSSLTDPLSTTHGIDMLEPLQMSSTTSSLGADLALHSSQSSAISLAELASMPVETVSPASSTSVSSIHRVESGRVEKRQRNTEAARRYRQRKLDKLSTVEEALMAMTKERDELRLELARARAEADILKGMVAQKS
jgi:hypothetical protein